MIDPERHQGYFVTLKSSGIRHQETGCGGADPSTPLRSTQDDKIEAFPSAVTLHETAPGKLNLTLDVLGKRPDGYHDLEMVMCSVSLADELRLELGTGGDWSVRCDRPGIPAGPDNLCWKAAAAYCEAAGVDPEGLSIHIEKKIPAQAGMAGGSSDAAAVLRALNRHYGRFSEEELRAVGLSVGGDVPYCLFGGVALAQGRGELLTRLPDLPGELWFVLAKPDFSVSTPELFREIDESRRGEGRDGEPTPADKRCLSLQNADLSLQDADKRCLSLQNADLSQKDADKRCLSLQNAGLSLQDADKPCLSLQAEGLGANAGAMIRAIRAQDRNAIGAAVQNDFEPLVARRFPIVETLRRAMLDHGAIGARLTGTGSVVYGLFCSRYRATAAGLVLKELCPHVWLEEPLKS